MLQALGSEKAWVIHGTGGLDELSTEGPTEVAELADGRIRRFVVTPADAGLEAHPVAALAGGDPEDNAQALRVVLDGGRGAYRDAVVLSAAAALVVADAAPDLATAAVLAAQRLDDGSARGVLARLVEASRQHG